MSDYTSAVGWMLGRKMESMRLGVLMVGLVAAVDFQSCWTRKDFNGECMWLYMSKVLGYFLVILSLGLKFPQISKILSSKSVSGISSLSFYVEVYSFGLLSAYCLHNNQPLNTFGDNLILGLQCVLQVWLLWLYGQFSLLHKVIVSAQFVAVFAYLAYGDVPDMVWSLIITSNLPINTIVKGSQMLANYQNQSTGQLSLGTVSLSFLGTCIRVLTSVVETNDFQLVVNYVIGTAYNAILLGQIYYYAPRKEKST